MTKNVKVVGVKITDPINDDMLSFLLNKVSKQRQEKARRYKFRLDSLRSILGELLIRREMIKKHNIKNNSIEFTQEQYGKPKMLMPSNQEFNISHAGNWVVCALSKQKIGIDIEWMKPIDLDIANRFFAKQESEALFQLPEDKRLERFYTLWTYKESYIKAIGLGMALSLNSFFIDIESEFENARLINIDSDSVNNYSLNQIEIDPQYKLAVCCLGEISNIEMHILSLSEIVDFFEEI